MMFVAVRVGGEQALGEELFGRARLRAVDDTAVGEQSRAFKIIERPATGPAVAAGEIVSEMFDGAVAGLAGAVVARQVGRRILDLARRIAAKFDGCAALPPGKSARYRVLRDRHGLVKGAVMIRPLGYAELAAAQPKLWWLIAIVII